MKLLKALPAPLLLLLAGGALLYGLGRWDQIVTARGRRLDAQTAHWLGAGHAWRGRFEGMVALATRDSAARVALRAENDSLMGAADSVAGILDNTPEPRLDDAAGWKVRYELRTVEVKRVRLAHAKTEAELVLAYQGRDRWQSIAIAADTTIAGLMVALEDERDARRCRIIGLIPCPSRGLAFVAGAVVTLVAVAAVP